MRFLRWRPRLVPAATSLGVSTIRQKSSCASISVTPEEQLIDQFADIRVTGLKAGAAYSVRLAVTNDINLKYTSLKHFTSAANGELSLSSKEHPMPLFRTLVAEEGFHQRFWSDDVTKPISCRLDVFPQGDSIPAVTTTFRRHYLAPGTQRVEIRSGRVRGTLFLPDRRLLPAPAVVTLHGGLRKHWAVEDIAAALSNHGFATLALAYFGVDGLPKGPFSAPIDIEYVEEAIDLLLGHDSVRGDGVGLWGISKGGEVALASASFLQTKVKAVAAINCSCKMMMVPAVYKGLESPGVPFDAADVTPIEVMPGVISIQGWDSEVVKAFDETVIGFARSPARFLFVAGEDDTTVSVRMTDLVRRAMHEAGKTNFEVACFPGMGHLVDLPYGAPSFCDYHVLVPKPMKLFYGGQNVDLHCEGQEKAWTKILQLFKQTLL